MSSIPPYTEPLPLCDGPKLRPFKLHRNTVNFIRLLSDGDPDGHAHVFEVSIDSRKFALKLFQFYDDEEHRAALFGKEREDVPVELLRAHMDPFYSECRAFGKIVESGLNGKIAVGCHGYLTISARRERELKEKFDIGVWNRPDEEGLKPASQKQPIRAIVKDLVPDTVPFTRKQANKILRDLKRIIRLDIYPRDVQTRNYVGGLLVDMSTAITKPHYLLRIWPKWRVDRLKEADLRSYDTMVKAQTFVTWNRATRNEEYCAKLRSRKHKG